MDTENKTVLTWNEKNVYPSEPIFVPAPTSKVKTKNTLKNDVPSSFSFYLYFVRFSDIFYVFENISSTTLTI